jgi:hypothetical protein
MGSKEIITIENDFTLFRFQNDTDEISTFQSPVNMGLIQFHFGLKGSAKFIFNNGNYTLDLNEEKYSGEYFSVVNFLTGWCPAILPSSSDCAQNRGH